MPEHMVAAGAAGTASITYTEVYHQRTAFECAVTSSLSSVLFGGRCSGIGGDALTVKSKHMVH